MPVSKLVARASFGLSSLAGLVAVAGATHAQAPIQPGYWDSTESYAMLLSGGSHDRKCLSTQQIQAFLAAPSTKHYRCTYPHQSISGGHARFDGGSCFSKAGRKVLSDVNITGDYGADHFHLDFHFRYMLNPKLGVPGTGAIDAHRLSATCPAPGSDADSK
jgi:hypothetical protein